MKSLIVLGIALFFAVPAFAQNFVDPNKPDAELTEEEAEIRLTEWRNKVNAAEQELNGINTQIHDQNTKLSQLQNDLKDCRDAIYRMIGATEADVQRFRERLGQVEASIRDLQKLNDQALAGRVADIDSVDNRLKVLRSEKLSVLPEFYTRITGLVNDIKTLRDRAKNFRGNTYTVGTWAKDRDCLWNIAGKDGVYNDPFMWPKIWQANTDKIRNPDLIFPGQVLTIPPPGPKTDEELKAERLYYRNKRAAARRTATASRRTQQVDQQEAGSGN